MLASGPGRLYQSQRELYRSDETLFKSHGTSYTQPGSAVGRTDIETWISYEEKSSERKERVFIKWSRDHFAETLLKLKICGGADDRDARADKCWNGLYAQRIDVVKLFLERCYQLWNEYLSQTDAHKIVKHLNQKAKDKLESWVVDVVKQTVIDVSETSDIKLNQAFIKGVFRSVWYKLLISIMNIFIGNLISILKYCYSGGHHLNITDSSCHSDGQEFSCNDAFS